VPEADKTLDVEAFVPCDQVDDVYFDRPCHALATLDDDPGARPGSHIFVGNKARWFEITDGLPQHQE
jgi:hypothetical protein